MVYVFFKMHINDFIYNSISSLFVAFVLALICSICLSCLTNGFFEHLSKKWKNKFWDEHIIHTLIYLSTYYLYSLYYNNDLCLIGYKQDKYSTNDDGIVKSVEFGYVPYLGEVQGQYPAWRLERIAREQVRRNCFSWELRAISPSSKESGKNAMLTYHRIKRLEPIAAAFGRDTNPKSIEMYHSLTEHIDTSKQELCTFMKETTQSAYAQNSTKDTIIHNLESYLNGTFIH